MKIKTFVQCFVVQTFQYELFLYTAVKVDFLEKEETGRVTLPAFLRGHNFLNIVVYQSRKECM